MDNFNNGSDMPEDVTTMVDNIVSQDPAADLSNQINQDLQAANEQPAGSVVQPFAPQQPVGNVVQPFAPQQPASEQPQMDGMPQQPQFGQPQMGGMPQQPQFGQPQMGGMNQQPQFGQPQMGGMPQQPQFGQPQMGGMNQQPQFGQPQMGGMNQQPYNMPPQGGKPPKKAKKPLSKGVIGGIIGGGVALIALIVCAIIFIPKLFPTDKEVVVDAFEATFGVETEAEADDFLGSQDIVDKFATTGGVREVSFEVTADSMGEVSTVNAGFVESIDVANKLANSKWTIGMNGSDFIVANLVIDENNTYFQLPEMINGYFSLPNENIFQALENSELGQSMGLTGMPEFNMADLYFNLATSNTATELNGEYVAIVEKLWDSITYEKQGKAKVDVNGKTVTTKEYFITVPEQAMKDAITEIWDAAIAEIAADPAMLEEMGMDAATFESTMSSYSGILTSLIQGDLVIKVYIKDDEIVKITSDNSISLYGATISYDAFLDVDDENVSGAFDITAMDETIGIKFNVANYDTAPNGKLSVTAAGETIDVNFSGTVTETDAAASCDLSFDVVYNGTTYVDGTSKVSVDNNAHSMDGSVVVNIADAGQLQVNYAGGFKDVNKGVGYTMELTKCEILADGQQMMNMTGKVKVDTSTHEATGIDTNLPVYDVTTLTEEAFNDIMALEENSVLLESWSNAHADLFGSMYEEPEEPAEPTEPAEPVESDMILEANGKSVEILGTIDGFTLDSVSDWYISYSTEEWSYIEYSLNEGFSAAESTDFIYVPDEGVIAEELNQTMDYNGETIYYSYVKYNDFGYDFSSYVFAKDIADGVTMVVNVGIYDEDEPVEYTKEMLVEAIDNKYFSIK